MTGLGQPAGLLVCQSNADLAHSSIVYRATRIADADAADARATDDRKHHFL